MKKLKLTTTLLCSLFFVSCETSHASLQFGVSASQIRIGGKYKTIESSPTLNTNLGYATRFEKIFLSVSTNRLLNSESSSIVEDTQNRQYQKITKSYIDTISSGIVLKEKYVPAIFISRASVENKLYGGGKFLGSEHRIALVKGVSFSLFVKKNVYTNVFLVAPEKKLNLKTSVGAGINILF